MKNRIIIIISVIGILGGIASAIYLRLCEAAAAPGLQSRGKSLFERHLCRRHCRERAEQRREHQHLSGSWRARSKKSSSPRASKSKQGEPLLRLDDSIQRATAEQLGFTGGSCEGAAGRVESGAEKGNSRCQRRASGVCRGHVENRPGYLAENANVLRDGSAICEQRCVGWRNQCRRGCESKSRSRQKAIRIDEGGSLGLRHSKSGTTAARLGKAYASSSALLGKYTLRAPRDGIVLSINTIVGNYASPQGSYDTYTQGLIPSLRWEALRPPFTFAATWTKFWSRGCPRAPK